MFGVGSADIVVSHALGAVLGLLGDLQLFGHLHFGPYWAVRGVVPVVSVFPFAVLFTSWFPEATDSALEVVLALAAVGLESAWVAVPLGRVHIVQVPHDLWRCGCG